MAGDGGKPLKHATANNKLCKIRVRGRLGWDVEKPGLEFPTRMKIKRECPNQRRLDEA